MRRADAAARAIRDFWTSSARSGERFRAVWSLPGVVSRPTPLDRLRRALARPVDALPLDVFRVALGCLSLAYFARTLAEAPLYSSPNGLLDHELSRAIFPYTWMGVFRPGMPLLLFQAVFMLACFASLAVIAGYRVKVCAAFLYAIAVSTYRWNFLVMYVDDVVMHLMLFWLLVLPTGRTLVLPEWLSQREKAWRRWTATTVPGAAARCFLWNVALIYVVAGLWKWTSPMWRNGTALYAVLKLPIARMPDFWGPQHLPLLKMLNYAALLLETIFPIVFFLPKGHRSRYALLMALLGFHLGMIATLQIPFANLACMAVTVVVFGPELMSRLRRRRPQVIDGRSGAAATIGFPGTLAIMAVVTLTMAMLSSIVVPEWRMPVRGKPAAASDNAAQEGLKPLQMAFFAPLWIAGLAQQYQLFNWIDDRNYAVRYEVSTGTHAVDPAAIFLPTTRGSLLQAYVLGVSWMQIPARQREQLRASIYIRAARRYCLGVAGSEDVTVHSTLRRIDAAHLDGAAPSRALLMQFQCRNGEPLMQTMNLNP